MMAEYCDRHPRTALIYEGPDGYATCPDCVENVPPDTRRVRITVDDQVVYDRDVPPGGLKYNRTVFTPVSRHPGQEIIELRAASDGLEGYDDRWTL